MESKELTKVYKIKENEKKEAIENGEA